MIGINLPADVSLALRTDPQALKSALTVAKLAALQPVGTVTDTVGPAEGGNTVQQGRAGTVGTGMPPAPEGAATTSARESFSRYPNSSIFGVTRLRMAASCDKMVSSIR